MSESMTPVAPARMVRRLRRLAERLGWPGVLGAMLIAASAGYYAGTLRALEQDIADARAERVAARGGASDGYRDGTRNGGADQLRRFIEFFPETESAPKWLGRVYALADREQVKLARGEYRLSEADALGLVQYRVVLPLRASYPQIRRFVTAVLREVPAVALSQLSFERQKIDERAIDARVELVLFLREGPARGGGAQATRIARP